MARRTGVVALDACARCCGGFDGVGPGLAVAARSDRRGAGGPALRRGRDRSAASDGASEPDWAALNRELKRKHVTLQILWDEYIEANPDGYRYSRFCELYRGWEARLPVTMRQTHLGGDKLFVDYAGDTVPVIVDRR